MEKQTEYKALAKNVLCVAVEGSVRDWAAYIGAVAGISHSEEWHEVRDDGAKLPEEIAKILFPNFRKLRYRA